MNNTLHDRWRLISSRAEDGTPWNTHLQLESDGPGQPQAQRRWYRPSSFFPPRRNTRGDAARRKKHILPKGRVDLHEEALCKISLLEYHTASLRWNRSYVAHKSMEFIHRSLRVDSNFVPPRIRCKSPFLHVTVFTSSQSPRSIARCGKSARRGSSVHRLSSQHFLPCLEFFGKKKIDSFRVPVRHLNKTLFVI